MSPQPLRIVGATPSAVDVGGALAEVAVGDPIAAEIEAALQLRRAGADARELRRALRRTEELLDDA